VTDLFPFRHIKLNLFRFATNNSSLLQTNHPATSAPSFFLSALHE